jgi:hypothetical protein
MVLRTAAKPVSIGSRSSGRPSSQSTRPLHASWLNQVEIYFSILQRKALTPDFTSLEALEERLHGFACYFETIARPFEWKFPRAGLASLLTRIEAHSPKQQPLPVAA